MQKLIILSLSILLVTGCATNSSTSLTSTLDHGSLHKFSKLNNTTKHGYQVVPDPTGTAPTEMVERFEVRSGECGGLDCGGSNGPTSRTGNRERSEIETDNNNYQNDEYWYGWSMFLPKDHENLWPSNLTLGQFYNNDGTTDRPDTCSSFMFQNSASYGVLRKGLTIDRQFKCFTREYTTILTDEELLGNWNRIEVHARWSNKEDGFFKVYTNGILKYDFEGRTMDGNGVFLKYGIYRCWVSLYYEKTIPTTTVLYANVKRSKTREGLAP